MSRGGGEEPRDEPRDERRDERGRTVAEAVTTAVSLGLLALLLAAILWSGYGRGRVDPARVPVELLRSEAERRGELWYLPFEVRNAGDTPVQEVLVVFEARRDGALVDESDTTITQLGEDERVRGEIVLEEDPRTLQVAGRVSAFQLGPA